MRPMLLLLLPLLAVACTPDEKKGRKKDRADTSADTSAPTADVTVVDEGLSSGYQDQFFGSWQRGRTALVADFDGDGWLDVASGNPADTSYILRNVTEEGGPMKFEAGQVLSDHIVFWGGAANDFDNDGDVDMYMAVGGNEIVGNDWFYRNDGTGFLVEEQQLAQTNLAGAAIEQATASATAFDLDNDGLLDVFGNSGVRLVGLVGSLEPEMVLGLNAVWRNNGDGTFTDVGYASGLLNQYDTRNSALLDFDNDGDMDLFENNFIGPNTLWRNRLDEDGFATFEDVTLVMSLGDGDMRFPYESSSKCSIASDLNNDGWEDIVVFRRLPKEPGEPKAHANTHLVWINVGGTGFVEVAGHTILANALITRDHEGTGVMGCQIGDLDADGAPDLFMGNGGPDEGQENQLFVSGGLEPVPVEISGVGEVMVPQWEDWSALIRFPAPHARHETQPDEYPYRTHASVMSDFDRDGLNELAEHNGGPSDLGPDDEMQEPNRLFKFHFAERPHWLRVIPRGDSTSVSRDAIGTRLRLVVSEGPDGPTREVYGTMRSSTGFAAQNGPDVLIGLGRADTVHELEVRWPDGHITIHPVDTVDTWIEVQR